MCIGRGLLTLYGRGRKASWTVMPSISRTSRGKSMQVPETFWACLLLAARTDRAHPTTMRVVATSCMLTVPRPRLSCSAAKRTSPRRSTSCRTSKLLSVSRRLMALTSLTTLAKWYHARMIRVASTWYLTTTRSCMALTYLRSIRILTGKTRSSIRCWRQSSHLSTTTWWRVATLWGGPTRAIWLIRASSCKDHLHRWEILRQQVQWSRQQDALVRQQTGQQSIVCAWTT